MLLAGFPASLTFRRNRFLTVRDSDEIMLITNQGQMVRTFVKDIREAGRNTMGVKLVNLDEGDKLQAIAPVINDQQEENAGDA